MPSQQTPDSNEVESDEVGRKARLFSLDHALQNPAFTSAPSHKPVCRGSLERLTG